MIEIKILQSKVTSAKAKIIYSDSKEELLFFWTEVILTKKFLGGGLHWLHQKMRQGKVCYYVKLYGKLFDLVSIEDVVNFNKKILDKKIS